MFVTRVRLARVWGVANFELNRKFDSEMKSSKLLTLRRFRICPIGNMVILVTDGNQHMIVEAGERLHTSDGVYWRAIH